MDLDQCVPDVGKVTRRVMDPDEFRHSGELNVEGRKHGLGTRFYGDVCKMAATCIDGKQCRKAVCTWTDGESWEVEYEDDAITGSALLLLPSSSSRDSE